MNKIKVLVVDDSAFMRKVISDIINSYPDMEVIEKARDGNDALQKIETFSPDVVTMDVEMPKLDGLSALKNIMDTNPVPVIMLSSLTQNGAEQTVKALQFGAVDFIPKPSGSISLDIEKVKDDIISKIRIAAGAKRKLQNLNINHDLNSIVKIKPPTKKIDYKKQLKKLIVMGTSTGGPKALHEVLPKIPVNIDAAILIVQHMPPGFTKSLADRLDILSQIKVKEAEHGEKVIPGCAYITPGNYHLNVESIYNQIKKDLIINLNQNNPIKGHRPSVDEMLLSVTKHFWSDIICVIMTGMGSDGSKNLHLIKQKGGKVIAEHQSTCIVYGMPKAAIQTGNVDSIVPLEDITKEIISMI
ncbi:Chemotaxis response regulator protein-glutamate methylesterase CheB [Candidatus Syntrophocurvum alkaliphilum]|uniref:Protein-glutamate methylesterase/protein-glutamine glutaminase n=1 Tax=Candidatus Syntrophocurvum alkaliphilum TaxID=2293317 RepID=A0A6I6D9S8_9FIRM|nr:chemotaxis response regulator protein-glutamate methylesterase [Candidatus Syntrophocurvum alkaliphilum]QGT99187.1 Chemotaxis response regulator protein-glutamate methylesterase CheB [Candidatus Syntrophocurvum alkaliphilum]